MLVAHLHLLLGLSEGQSVRDREHRLAPLTQPGRHGSRPNHLLQLRSLLRRQLHHNLALATTHEDILVQSSIDAAPSNMFQIMSDFPDGANSNPLFVGRVLSQRTHAEQNQPIERRLSRINGPIIFQIPMGRLRLSSSPTNSINAT